MEFPKETVHLAYSATDFACILDYLERNETECGGRYELGGYTGLDGEPDPNILVVIARTHPRTNPYLTAESEILCGFHADLAELAIVLLGGGPNFDVETAWFELGTLEMASMGQQIHGRRC